VSANVCCDPHAKAMTNLIRQTSEGYDLQVHHAFKIHVQQHARDWRIAYQSGQFLFRP
jgi:hypothetical protein